MKKLLTLLIFLLLCIQPAYAEKIQATAMNSLDVENPPETFLVTINQTFTPDSKIIISSGSVLTTSIYKAKKAKRLKMKAKLVLKIDKITEPDGTVYVPNNLYAKYTKLVNKVNATKEAAVSVGGLFVKHISVPFHAVEGAIKNTEGNRAKSALKGAYDASPLSYASKGESINIETDDIIYLEFDSFNPNDVGLIDKIKY